MIPADRFRMQQERSSVRGALCCSASSPPRATSGCKHSVPKANVPFGAMVTSSCKEQMNEYSWQAPFVVWEPELCRRALPSRGSPSCAPPLGTSSTHCWGSSTIRCQTELEIQHRTMSDRAMDPAPNGTEQSWDPAPNGIKQSWDPAPNCTEQSWDPAPNGTKHSCRSSTKQWQ